MKKILSIVTLSLLISTYVYASEYALATKEWNNQGGSGGDPLKTIILDKGDNYIVIRNNTADTSIFNKYLKINLPAQIFLITAKNHCKKNKIYNYVSDAHKIIFDENTIYFYCSAIFSNLSEFKGLNLSKDDKTYLALLWAKIVYNIEPPVVDLEYNKITFNFPFFKELAERIKQHNIKLSNPDFIYKVKLQAYNDEALTDIPFNINKAKKTCLLMDIQSETKEFSTCILNLLIIFNNNIFNEGNLDEIGRQFRQKERHFQQEFEATFE
jgi:hypothetical protein